MSTSFMKNLIKINLHQYQIYNKFGLLLDKPISPLVTKQLIQLIDNISSNKSRLFNIVLQKFRGDLLIYMLQKYPFQEIGNNDIKKIQFHLLKNINKNQLDTSIAIYKYILSHLYQIDSNNILIYVYGYDNLLKNALKSTNLQIKNMLFAIINSNILLFKQLKLKNNLRKNIQTFIQIFKKYTISVQNYVIVMKTIINIIQQSKLNKDKNLKQLKNKVENSKSNQDININQLPDINGQNVILISNQLLNILSSTKDRPLHLLHNQCLLTLTYILQNYGQKFIKQTQIYKYNKINQIFLYRKGTRDSSRKLQSQIQQIQKYIIKQNQLKMVKQYSISSFHSINSIDHDNDKPLLIQNIIDKTNNYLAKYQIKNIKSSRSYSQQKNINLSPSKNKNFFKKGNGIGGGKTYFIDLNNKQNNIQKQQNKKSKYDFLLENCINKCLQNQGQSNSFIKQSKPINSNALIKQSKEINFISLITQQKTIDSYPLIKQQKPTNSNTLIKQLKPIKSNNVFKQYSNQFFNQQKPNNSNLNNQLEKFQINNFLSINEGKSESYYYIRKNIQQIKKQEMNQKKYINNRLINQFDKQSQYKKINNQRYEQEDNQKNNITSNITTFWENDQQVNQINQLIDLAYSYKFNIN